MEQHVAKNRKILRLVGREAHKAARPVVFLWTMQIAEADHVVPDRFPEEHAFDANVLRGGASTLRMHVPARLGHIVLVENNESATLHLKEELAFTGLDHLREKSPQSRADRLRDLP